MSRHTILVSHRPANAVQACLNAPEPSSGDANGVDADNSVESPEDNHAQVPTGQPRGMPPNNNAIPQAYMTPEAALHYQSYLQQQQQTNQYPMAQQGMPRHPGGHYPQEKLG
jgi:pheromone receptor transcription factor